jgi:signal transduction histidine kinase
VVLNGLAGEVTEKQRHLLSRMKSRIGGVLEMTNNLLDLSKIEARQFVQQKKAMDINPIIREACSMMDAQVQGKGLTLILQLAPDLLQVMIDPISMGKVVTNLLSNAIRYTPTGGHIKVSSGVEANYVQFSVADTGIGIEEEYLDKIFDRFFRVKNEKARNIVGDPGIHSWLFLIPLCLRRQVWGSSPANLAASSPLLRDPDRRQQ